MNTISSIGQSLTTDGLGIKNNASQQINSSYTKNANNISNKILIAQSGSEVVDNIERTEASIKEDAKELQKLSDLVMGPKLQFNVNNELGSVIVKIVDPSTEQVIKEIPSEDMQKLKVRIRKAIGVLFDEMI